MASNEPYDAPSTEVVEIYDKEEERLLRPLLVRRDPSAKHNAEWSSNPISRLFLLFVGQVMDRANELDADMEPHHLDPLVGDDESHASWTAFDREWRAERAASDKPSITKALVKATSDQLPIIMFTAVFEALGPFASIVLLANVNDFVADPEAPFWHAVVIASVFWGVAMIAAIAAGQGFRAVSRMIFRIKSMLLIEVSRKTIHLSGEGLKAVGGSGVLFQVFQSDVTQIGNNVPMLIKNVDIPLQLIGAFTYLGVLVGWPVVGALAMFCIVIPFNYRISDSFIGLFFAKMMAGDNRTKKIVEILNAIRVVKFNGWEKPLRATVDALRSPELDMIRQLMGKMALLMCSFSMATPLVQLILFVLLTVKDSSSLSVLLFFQALGLTNILGLIMVRIPFIYSEYLRMMVSIDRVERILQADEREELQAVLAEGSATGDVSVNGDFVWETEKVCDEEEGEEDAAEDGEEKKVSPSSTEELEAVKKTLVDVKFHAGAGELVAIVGKVGSGKSSLVSALLGEMRCTAGTVFRNGSVAYVPQTAWILNATVRNNILVNQEYDEERYQRVLQATDLLVDLRQLPNGDLTEVGEKGINLSGGQRQRVSIARALYQDADIYVFDDPLSALDAHVGRHVFDSGIMDMLAKKTRILVTHQMSYLPHAERVYVCSMESSVMHVACERLPESVRAEAASGESPLVAMLRAWNATNNDAQGSPTPSPSHSKNPNSTKNTDDVKNTDEGVGGNGGEGAASRGRLTVREERESGAVKSSTFFMYLSTFGGPLFWILVVLLHVFVVACNIFSQLWMGWWTTPPSENPPFRDFWQKYDPVFYLGIYAAAFVVAAIVVLLRELLWREGAVTAPRQLYDRMLNSVLHAKMAFFDTTPVGRIINRFTKDSEELDFSVPTAANQVAIMFFSQLGSLIAICVVMPLFIPVAAVCAVILLFIQPTVATVVLHRLSTASAGPVAALYSEIVNGAASIRSLGLTSFFSERISSVVDDANAAQYIDELVFESIRVKVNVVMAFLQFAIVMVIAWQRDNLSPTLAAFIIVQGMQLTMYMGYMMFQRGQLTLSLNSIERLREYSVLESEEEGSVTPSDSWPQTGTVDFVNVSAQYRENLPRVLKDVNVNIAAGEKVGVCGRTGSGKSSLLLTVFRMLPLLEGSEIRIDGVDTATMPLESLRKKISAIPQEPVIFSGTVRENIDPFGEATDEELIDGLKMCHLKDALQQSLPSESQSVLDLTLSEGDLSVGQKQLLCLARAVIRKTRVLVLDEATSSVDVHTDQLIQETIRSVFANCTVITVAHRLNTIMDSDRVLVLDHGSVAEFGTPSQLLTDSESIFAALVADHQDLENSSPGATMP